MKFKLLIFFLDDEWRDEICASSGKRFEHGAGAWIQTTSGQSSILKFFKRHLGTRAFIRNFTRAVIKT